MNWSVDMKKVCERYMVTWFLRHNNIKEHPEAWSDLKHTKQSRHQDGKVCRPQRRELVFFASRAARAKACRSMLKSQEMYVKQPLTVIFPSWQRLKDTTESETGALDTHPHTQTHTGTLPLLPPNRYRPHYWKLTDRALHNLLTNDTTGRN